MKALVLRPKKSAPGDGYGAFGPEGNRFAKMFEAPIVEVEAQKMKGTVPISEHSSEKMKRRAAVVSALRQYRPEWVALFCHGWSGGVQLGFETRHAPDLALVLAEIACYRVTLYACGCGAGAGKLTDGDGGFADALRDAMCRVGIRHCRVDAHSTVGHATQNPYVRRFEGQGSPTGGMGGQWIVAPGSQMWPYWRRALRTDFRFRFSDLDVAEIHAEVVKA